MIYQRMVDNAPWGVVQPKGGYPHYAKLTQEVKNQAKMSRGGNSDASTELSAIVPNSRTTFEAGQEA